MLRFTSILMLLAMITSANYGHSKTICSLALNSSNEFHVFRRALEPQGFRAIELVPESSSNDWFSSTCRTQVQCDILLISGHFGGLFFGEQKTGVLPLSTLERASCENSCSGLLKHPKEVFLLGCNTLATHTPDHRTLGQYLNVLVNDGFPLGLAEEVAVARYGNEGLSLADRFSQVFGSQTSIYGFTSTGPTGAQAAPLLKKYLSSIPDYWSHLTQKKSSMPNLSLSKALGHTSFKELKPSQRLSISDQALVCDLQSGTPSRVENAFQAIANQKQEQRFLDRIRESLVNLSPRTPIQREFRSIQAALDQSRLRNGELFEVRFKNILALSRLASPAKQRELLLESQQLIDHQLARASDQLEIDRICSLAKVHNHLEFRNSAFSKMPAPHISKFALAGCFHQIEDSLFNILVAKLSSASLPEKEILQASLRLFTSSTSNASTTSKAGASPPGSLDYDQCLAQISQQKHLTAGDRDGGRWRCWNQITQQSETSCLKTLSQMELPESKDFGWQCLELENPTLMRCLAVADEQSSQKQHDDMIWNCYDRLSMNGSLNRTSCMVLQHEMLAQGNQIKMQWNCQNRISY